MVIHEVVPIQKWQGSFGARANAPNLLKQAGLAGIDTESVPQHLGGL
jgi:hypothetical protein